MLGINLRISPNYAVSLAKKQEQGKALTAQEADLLKQYARQNGFVETGNYEEMKVC